DAGPAEPASPRPVARTARREGAGLRRLGGSAAQISVRGEDDPRRRRARHQAGFVLRGQGSAMGSAMVSADLLAPASSASGVLVAVSGGPDSMALTELAARWRDGAAPGGIRPPIFAAT